MEHEEILHRCFRCGYCKLPGNYVDINCPAYLAFRFETYAPGGRMWLLRAWLDNKITAGSRFAEIMFACATCGNWCGALRVSGVQGSAPAGLYCRKRSPP